MHSNSYRLVLVLYYYIFKDWSFFESCHIHEFINLNILVSSMKSKVEATNSPFKDVKKKLFNDHEYQLILSVFHICNNKD